MKRKEHDNYKVQEAYNYHGSPSVTILEVCTPEELDRKELYWIEEFNSINNGLNICGSNNNRSGLLATNVKYTKIQLLLVFRKLRDPTISYDRLSSVYGVHRSTISHIAAGLQHTWLHSKYPNIWNQIQKASLHKKQFKNSIANKHSEIKKIKHKDGRVLVVDNISKVARENGLHTSRLSLVLRGIGKSTGGWSLV